jgi:hypothetical protein
MAGEMVIAGARLRAMLRHEDQVTGAGRTVSSLDATSMMLSII